MDDTMQHTPLTATGNQDAMTDKRGAVAGVFNNVADTLHERAESMNGGRLAGITDRTANALDATGRYVREFNSRDVVNDLTKITKDHPGKALLAAMALGLLVGRSMTRSQA